MRTPRSKHQRSGSAASFAENSPIIQGEVARESTIVDRLLNKRYGALYPTSFVTYRKQHDDSPSKVWPITKDVQVSVVRDRKDYHLRHAGTSTLWAVARGAYETKHMWGFTLTWEGLTGGADKLTLAFGTKEVAEEWHSAFAGAVASAAARAPARTVSSASERSLGSVDAEATVAGAAPGEVDSAAANGQPPVGRAPARRSRAWASVLHINGVSVYVEEVDEAGGGGAMMVSAVVRAPLADVFNSLVQVRRTEGLGVFAGARTLEVIDANTQVVAQRWRGSGAVGGLCAPREMVLLRTWRRDEDGTHVVLYQSTTHRAARPPGGWLWSWYTPVRVTVQAAGFTIAPLLPQYTHSGESQESLVTLVLKADLGGFLSDRSPAGRVLSPVCGFAVRSMMEPVVTSLVVLRDRVEQNRFVVRPLSMAAGEDAGDRERAVQGGGEQAARMERTSTTLVYHRHLLPAAAADSAAAEKAAAAAPAAAPPPAAEDEAEGEDVGDAWALAGSCPRRFWSSPGSCGFRLRGPGYLTDRKKIPAAPPMFELVAVDLLELEEPMFHVCRHLPSVKHSAAPFLFCTQLMVPSSPPVSLVCSWAAPTAVFGADPAALIAEFEEQQGPCPDHVAAFFRAFADFVEGEGPEADRRRNSKFKLIPNIAKGSWIIKQSVGTTPVLLGQKLTTKYYRGARYFEVDVDIGASSVAASITNLVCGTTKTLALDMGVLVEGQELPHLPEQLIGTVRLDRLDLKTAAYFDEATGRVLKPDQFDV